MSVYPNLRTEALHSLITRVKQFVHAQLYCPYCGTKNTRQSVLCRKCGRKLPPAKDIS